VDLGTLLGAIAAFGLIVGAMSVGGSPLLYLDMASVMLVIFGTVAITFVACPPKRFFGAVKIAMNALFDRTPSAAETSATIRQMAAKVRREGILSMENEQIDDKFLSKAVRLAVDGVPADTIDQTLRIELGSLKARHEDGQSVFKFMEKCSPAMGMVGTLIGLVRMLQNLDDPSAIGPAMAVALLTTLYGAVIANVMCAPITQKLEDRTKAEGSNMTVIIEGIAGIVKGENALIIKERLESFLEPSMREDEEANRAA
jgi:chemotaxis protein MotA